ncbi:unnamed protein product [Mytilus coruscus]|uniref:Uncharacterized protein n=1 Tax=Mytilus coruscus TaxID=42192 RepID=A0A6J8D403_MYTCO|nr:unnamed protein product [Mytilus coruscus]
MIYRKCIECAWRPISPMAPSFKFSFPDLTNYFLSIYRGWYAAKERRKYQRDNPTHLCTFQSITFYGARHGVWLSGNFGNQGLWNYCYTNGTSSCCGKLDDVVGYKGFCTFLSITIYGSRHDDVSKSTMNLSVSYIFCAQNLSLQIIIGVIGLCWI